MFFRVCLIVFVVAGSGCQHGASRQPEFHEGSFSELWDTYRHCQKSDNPHEMKADVLRLNQTVEKLTEQKKIMLIPDRIEEMMVDRPSRLAVDPKAMAASCALLTGYQARVAGEPGLAAEMFGHIVSNYSITRYRYYVVQAYHGLKGIDGGDRFLPKQFLSRGLGPEL
jgi:hypothetical protein